MIIYLASPHSYPWLIAELIGGGNGNDFLGYASKDEIIKKYMMKIYLAGGVSGNLNPARRRMARTSIDGDGFIQSLKDENFLGRIERQKMDTAIHSRGGIFSEDVNENIYGRCSTVERRGGV